MSKRRILTIGFELASTDTHYERMRSKVSLLDWDVILFVPEILTSFHYSEHYQGKPSFNDTSSFQLKDACEHWRREIKQSMDAGKTIVVFLPEVQAVFVDSGQRSFSGTGRNQKTTIHVEHYDNYKAIPAALVPVNSTGKSMKLAPRGAEVLASYWAEFGEISEYRVHLTQAEVPASIVTHSGDRTVGAIYRSKTSAGSLVLLPHIDFYASRFLKEKDGKQHWNAAGTQFAAKFVSAIVELDKTLRNSGQLTPEPQWASRTEFSLSSEHALRISLLDAETRVAAAQQEKENFEEQLRSAGSLRALLFEKGKPLENAIISALRLIGFAAQGYKNSDSEFDVVFESKEGRLIGEAEGKDNKAISVEKLRQLAMNVHEDLAREEVSKPAKPVLFGNAFRLSEPLTRGACFTDKCVTAAATSSTALVPTMELFRAVQQILLRLRLQRWYLLWSCFVRSSRY